MAESSPTPRPRPRSPHLQIWRWHLTLAASILHRATGLAIYVGLMILVGWVFALDAGAETYSAFTAVLGSLPGKSVLALITLALFFHLANGVRHLFWDVGKGFALKTANATAAAAFVFAAAATLGFWAALALHGSL